MRVFVTGGTGFVGDHVVSRLLQDGHEVVLLEHRQRKDVRPGVSRVCGDVLDSEACAGFMDGCEAVVNLVGIIREFPGRGVTFEKLHVEAAASLTRAASRSGVGRFLQMSALGSRPAAVSGYHKSKFRAEEIVRASGLAWTIFRPSLIFGPRDAFVNMLAGYVRSFGAVPVIGNGEYRLQPIAAGDVARCFSAALTNPETVGKSYELCGVDRFSYNDLVDTIGRAVGRGSVLKLKAPLAILGLVVPLLQSLPAFPLTTDQMQMLLEESICDGCWRETFRFDPVPFEKGIREYL